MIGCSAEEDEEHEEQATGHEDEGDEGKDALWTLASAARVINGAGFQVALLLAIVVLATVNAKVRGGARYGLQRLEGQRFADSYVFASATEVGYGGSAVCHVVMGNENASEVGPLNKRAGILVVRLASLPRTFHPHPHVITPSTRCRGRTTNF